MTPLPEGRSPASIASALLRAHAAAQTFVPFAAPLGMSTIEQAYVVQDAFVDLQARSRETSLAGYKIGLTSRAMQAMCRIGTPVAGVVLADRVKPSGSVLKRSAYGRLGLEFEIAVRIGRDLPGSARPFTLEEIVPAVDAVAPAMEIIDDRFCDYETLDVCSLVADNAWNAGIVLGAFRSTWPDLANVVGAVSVDGELRHRGRGSDVLGHPLHPVVWLAQHLAAKGAHLRAGQIVMTGSLVATQFPAASAPWSFDVSGLGVVAVEVVA